MKRVTQHIGSLLGLLLFSVSASAATNAVGTTSGTMSVSKVGKISYAVGIDVPPGVNKMQPRIGIVYSSKRGMGVAGMGASISGLSSIARCSQSKYQDAQINHSGDIQQSTHSPVTLDKADNLCLDGQLLVLVNGTAGEIGAEYRTFTESFRRIRISDATSISPLELTVELPSGHIQTYGGSPDSLTQNANGAVLAWKLSTTQDRFGNSINYQYSDFGGDGATELHLTNINYGGAANVSVQFDYESKPDVSFGYPHGLKVSNTQRLTAIQTSVGSRIAKRYSINYEQTPTSNKSRIQTIQECAWSDASEEHCVSPLVFDWNELTPSYVEGQNSTPDNLVDDAGRNRGRLIDINGDGRADWITSYQSDTGSVIAATWLGQADGSWSESPAYSAPSPLYKHSDANSVVRLASLTDIDGDGLRDWVQAYANNGVETIQTWKNTGNGWETDASINDALKLPAPLYDITNADDPRSIAQLVDLDKDARPDFIVGIRANDGSTTQAAYLKTDSGWNESVAYKPAVLVDFSDKPNGLVTGQFVDINADGLVDWVESYSGGVNSGSGVWLNTGAGWNSQNAFSNALPSTLISHDVNLSPDGNSKVGSLIDVNGDRLPDWVEAYSNGGQVTTQTWLNLGDGSWEASTGYQLPVALAEFDASGHRQITAQLIDTNKNGFKDLVSSYRTTSGSTVNARWGNTGSGWAPDLQSPLVSIRNQHRTGAPSFSELVEYDINHDGLADVIETQSTSWLQYVNEGGIDHAERLVGVTDGFGVEKLVEYAVSSQAINYTPSQAQVYPFAVNNRKRTLPYRVKSSDGNEGYLIAEHAFFGGLSHRLKGSTIFTRHHFEAAKSRVMTFANFYKTELAFGAEKSTQTLFNGRTISNSSSTYEKRLFNAGKTYLISPLNETVESRDDVGSGEGTLLHTVAKTYAYTDGESAPDKVTVQLVETDALNAGATVIKTSETEFFNKQTSDIWLALLPTAIKETAQQNTSPAVVVESKTTYTDEGKVDIQRQDPDQALELKADRDYDVYGNLIKVTVSAPNDPSAPPARVTSTTYSIDGRFPENVTNAQGHTATNKAHEVYGLVTETIDPNGIKANIYYDAFGRVENKTTIAAGSSSASDVNSSTAIYKSCDGIAVCPTGAVYYIGVLNSEGSPTPRTTYFDKLQREIRVQSYGKGGAVIYQDTEYSYDAQTSSTPYASHVRQSLPYFKTSTEPKVWLKNSVDSLGRDVKKTASNGVVTVFNYEGRTIVKTTNPDNSGYLRQVESVMGDPMDRPILIVDAENGRLSYQYNAAGHLLTTEDSDGVVTTHTPDNRGRPISRNDPDLGFSSYVHNAFGNLIQKTNAKQQVFTYQYDKLDRLTSRNEPDELNQTSYISTWAYDQGAHAIGRLSSLVDNRGFEKTVTYDTLGRQKSIGQTVDGELHTTDMTYYGNGGQIGWIKYSSGLSIRQTFDEFGTPDKISSKGYADFHGYYENLDLATEKSDAAKAMEESSGYQSTLSALESQKAAKNDLITTYTNQRTTYNNQVTTYNNQRTTYRNQVTTYNNQRTTYNNQVTTYRNQRTTYNNQVTTYRNQRTTYSNDINRYTAARDQHRVNYQSWLNKYKSYIASSNTATSRANNHYAAARRYQSAHDAQARTYNRTKQSAAHSLNLYRATGHYNHYIDHTNHNKNAASVWKWVVKYKGLTDSNNRSGNIQAAKARSDYNYAKNTAYPRYKQEVNNYNADNSRRNTAISNYNTATSRYNTAASNYNTATARYNTAASNYNAATARYNTAASNHNTALARYNTAVGNYNAANSNRNAAITAHDSLVSQINAHTKPVRDLYASANSYIDNANDMLAAYETISEQHFESLQDNAFGQITQFKLGESIETTNTFDPLTGHLQGIFTKAGSASTDVIQSNSYQWDSIGNLINRTNNVAGYDNGVAQTLNETFTYDGLNRLKTSDLSGTAAQTYNLHGIAQVSFEYSANGNLTYRSDVGTLNYDHPTKAHAVTSVEKANSSIGYYSYDDNGNMVSKSTGESVDYTSFDKPTKITTSQSTTTLTYGADRSLIKEQVTKTDGTTSTTLFFGAYQKIVSQGVTKHRHTVRGFDGKSIATINQEEGSGADTNYLHHDHLGSIVAISDVNGAVLGRFHFDAFGKRRNAIGHTTTSANLATSITRQGYTGHIELSDSDFVYMNARVYDASIGRFLSADPVLPDQYDLQQYNRYSYVSNNPLKYVDPTGNKQENQTRETHEKQPTPEVTVTPIIKKIAPTGSRIKRDTLVGANVRISSGGDQSVPIVAINLVFQEQKWYVDTVGINSAAFEEATAPDDTTGNSTRLVVSYLDLETNVHAHLVQTTCGECDAESENSLDQAIEGLSRNPAPNVMDFVSDGDYGDPVKDGEEVYAFPVGDVIKSTLSDDAGGPPGAILNTTQPTHILDPGVVIRWTSVENNRFTINTFGFGTGHWGPANNDGAAFLWGTVDQGIINFVNDQN